MTTTPTGLTRARVTNRTLCTAGNAARSMIHLDAFDGVIGDDLYTYTSHSASPMIQQLSPVAVAVLLF